MTYPYPGRILTLSISWLFILSLSHTLSAAEPDRSPINIQADRAMVSELEGLSIYSGHVVISQGTLQILADEVRLTSFDNRLTTIVAVGNAEDGGQAGFTLSLIHI